MFSRFRDHFGTAGLVVAIVALVAALAGGALAANSNGGGKATASKAGKRGPKGPRGPKGDTGAPGPAGPVGPQGPAGANGKDGTNGTNGAAGATGATGKTGSTGATGNTGFSGFTATLPAGSTETGTWAFTESAGWVTTLVPISFNIPLGAELDGSHVHFASDANFGDFDEGGPDTEGCTGTVAAPTAPAGHLCVYSTFLGASKVNAVVKATFDSPGASTSGADLAIVTTEDPTNTHGASGAGTYAVTAPPPGP